MSLGTTTFILLLSQSAGSSVGQRFKLLLITMLITFSWRFLLILAPERALRVSWAWPQTLPRWALQLGIPSHRTQCATGAERRDHGTHCATIEKCYQPPVLFTSGTGARRSRSHWRRP